jgi:hypothetical protein
MKEVYIKYDTALLAREKGLSFVLDDGDNCMCYHIGDKNWHFAYHVHMLFPDKETHLFAPSQAFVAKWLREKHNIQVYCFSNTKNGKGRYRDYVVHVNEQSMNDARDEEFQTYEEAFEVGLQLALEMI